MRVAAVVWSLILFLANSADDVDKIQRPVPLNPQSSTSLNIPPFRTIGNIQCDSKGNLYFHTGYSYRDGIIMRLTKEGIPSLFSLSKSDHEFLAFEVSPRGKIWMLSSGRDNMPHITGIDPDDPSSQQEIVLNGPKELDILTVQNFAVVGPNQKIILQGYFDEKAPITKRGHGYLAVFASSGNLLDMTIENPSRDTIRLATSWIAQGVAPQALDGTTYLWSRTQLQCSHLLESYAKGYF